LRVPFHGDLNAPNLPSPPLGLCDVKKEKKKKKGRKKEKEEEEAEKERKHHKNFVPRASAAVLSCNEILHRADTNIIQSSGNSLSLSSISSRRDNEK